MPWKSLDTLSADCPKCDSVNTFAITPKVGQRIKCSQCGTKLEVAYLRPIMLDYTFEDNTPRVLSRSIEDDSDSDFDDEDY